MSETHIKIGCGCGSLDGYRRDLARIPGITEAEALAMAKRYNEALREVARAAQTLTLAREVFITDDGEPFEAVVSYTPTARVWHVGSRTGKGFPSATLAHFDAVDPPPKPAPRGVCVGLALAGWPL